MVCLFVFLLRDSGRRQRELNQGDFSSRLLPIIASFECKTFTIFRNLNTPIMDVRMLRINLET